MTADLAVLDTPERASMLMDPLRLQVLEQLRDPGSSTTVAADLGMPRQRVNYHVRALEDAGLLRLVEERRKGNCTERVLQATARHYVVSPEALGRLGVSAGDVKDRFSSAYLLAQAAQTIREVGALRVGADAAGKKLATLSLETEVRFANAADQHAFAEGLAQALAALAARYHTQDAPNGRRFRFTVGGHPAASNNSTEADNVGH